MRNILEKKQTECILQDLFIQHIKSRGIKICNTSILQDYLFLISKFGPSNELISQIFKIKDLALRYDLTMPLLKSFRPPITRCEIGLVFRNSPVSKTRFREFIQADLDSTILQFEEILKIYIEFLDSLKIQFTIEINHTNILDKFFEFHSNEDRRAYLSIIDKIKKKNLHNLYDELLQANLKKGVFDDFRNLKEFEQYISCNELQRIYKIDNRIILNHTLVRGLNFYKGFVCQIFCNLSKESICSGGEYIYNNNKLAGLSLGISRLSAMIHLKPKLIIIIKQKIDWINFLINPYTDIINYKDIKRSFRFFLQDCSKKYKLLIILGKREIESKQINLKNFENSEITKYNISEFLFKYIEILTNT